MKLCTKKGSTIVEAALIFPIVIITVIGVLSLAILFYE
ncbi:MAG: pilus assembly protein [Clostridiales bacterium]|nr:pilus assembly protein [Clostridiales bacterium]